MQFFRSKTICPGFLVTALSTLIASCTSTGGNVFEESDRRIYQSIYAKNAPVLVAACEAALYGDPLPEAELDQQDFSSRSNSLSGSITYQKNQLGGLSVRLPFSKMPDACLFEFDRIGGLTHLPKPKPLLEPMKEALNALGYSPENNSTVFSKNNRRLSLTGKLDTSVSGGTVRNDLKLTLTRL